MKWHLVDMDDGPDGGGGVALAAALSRAGIEHKCWCFSTLASGWTDGTAAELIRDTDADAFRKRFDSEDVLVPGTLRALSWLAGSGIDDDQGASIHESVLDCVEPVGTLVEAGKAGVPLVEHELVMAKPVRRICAEQFHGGWILDERGYVHSVADGEEAWFRISAMRRKGSRRCALIPRLGRFLFAGCHLFRDGDVALSSWMRVDSMRPSWRPALGRTVSGRIWTRAAHDLTALEIREGFVHSLWAWNAAHKKARLVALLPLPAPWLAAVQEELVAALQGDGPVESPADRCYADAPIDLALTENTLMERL